MCFSSLIFFVTASRSSARQFSSAGGVNAGQEGKRPPFWHNRVLVAHRLEPMLDIGKPHRLVRCIDLRLQLVAALGQCGDGIVEYLDI
jgi:hypothetical protein